MLPVRTTSPQGEPEGPGGESVVSPDGARPSEAPALSNDTDALELAAMRLRPSWEGPPVELPDSAAPAAAPTQSAPLVEAAIEPAPEPVVEPRARTSARPSPQVDTGASIIVNEPGVIVLDAPPIDMRMPSVSPIANEPTIPRMSPSADMLSGQPAQAFHDDEDDIAPPLTSRRPWLWAAGGAVLGIVVLVLTVGRSEPTSARLSPAPADKPVPVAVPMPAADPVEAAKEPIIEVVEPPPAPAEAVAAPAPEPELDEPPASTVRKPRKAKAARIQETARVARVQDTARSSRTTSPTKLAAPAVVHTPQPAAKKPRKGAGFVSSNPYQ